MLCDDDELETMHNLSKLYQFKVNVSEPEVNWNKSQKILLNYEFWFAKNTQKSIEVKARKMSDIFSNF